MELSKIANLALSEMTDGKFTKLSKLAVMGLLNDFQYAWMKRFDINYDDEKDCDDSRYVGWSLVLGQL